MSRVLRYHSTWYTFYPSCTAASVNLKESLVYCVSRSRRAAVHERLFFLPCVLRRLVYYGSRSRHGCAAVWVLLYCPRFLPYKPFFRTKYVAVPKSTGRQNLYYFEPMLLLFSHVKGWHFLNEFEHVWSVKCNNFKVIHIKTTNLCQNLYYKIMSNLCNVCSN